MIALGCKAGTPHLCNELGAVLFNQASGPPEEEAELARREREAEEAAGR